MTRLPSYIVNVTHYFKGGAKAPKPPAPPAASTAAENLAKSKVLDRQRLARGFSSTILGGYNAPQSAVINRPATLLSTILGG